MYVCVCSDLLRECPPFRGEKAKPQEGGTSARTHKPQTSQICHYYYYYYYYNVYET